MPPDSANALSAAGLISGTPHSTPLPIDDEDREPAQRLVEGRFETDLGNVVETLTEQTELQPAISRHTDPEVKLEHDYKQKID